MKESIFHIVSSIESTLERTDLKKMDEIVESIARAKQIFVYGVGRSGLVGKAFAMRLVQLGLKVYFIGETITPIVEKEDLVIIISNTGETYSVIQTANIVRRVGATVVALTAVSHSKLSHAASIQLLVQPKKDESTERLAPLGTLFEDATLILLDAVVTKVMERLNQTEKDMRGRHAIWV